MIYMSLGQDIGLIHYYYFLFVTRKNNNNECDNTKDEDMKSIKKISCSSVREKKNTQNDRTSSR